MNMRFIFLFVLLLTACSQEKAEPSSQCRSVWSLRDEIKFVPAKTIEEIEHKHELLSRADWCDKNPEGAWL